MKNYISSEDFLKSLSQVKETDYKNINKSLVSISKDMHKLADKINKLRVQA